MEIKSVKISTDGWEESDIEEICTAFPPSTKIEQKNLTQLLSGLEIAIIIGIVIGGKVTDGFFGAIGGDIWDKLKNKFSKDANEKKYSTIGLEVTNGTSTAKFNLKTKDPVAIERAFDTIDDILTQVKTNEIKSQYHFDDKNKNWIKIEDRKFAKRVEGIVASTELVKKGDKIIQFTVPELEKFASQMIDSPLTLEHGGKQIGKITKAWVEDEKLKYEAGIYEGITEEDEEKLNDIISSGGGPSIGFKS